MNTIPRIKGRVGQATENGNDIGWCFEISVFQLDGETVMMKPVVVGPFESEKKALQEMRTVVKNISEDLTKHFNNGKPTGRYIDMKNGGVLRDWEEN